MNMFRNLKIAQKLYLGFGAVCAILIISVASTYILVKRSESLTNRVIELRAPTAKLGVELLNGVNASLAHLRGYMLLGKEDFKIKRKQVWDETIDPSLARMGDLSKNWTVQANKDKYHEVKTLLEELKGAQEEIEEMAFSPENEPATKILLTQAAPAAAKQVKLITSIIDEELALDGNATRKQMLGMMADVRGSLGMGLANIRAYLLTGDEKFAEQFRTFWSKNTKRYSDLSRVQRKLTASQQESFQKFSDARSTFDPLPEKMFSIRSGNEWNTANYWLGTKAAPRASKASQILNGMIENQAGLMSTDAKRASTSIHGLVVFLGFMLVIGFVLSFGIAYVVISAIREPVKDVVEMIKDIAEGDGDLTKRVQASSNDEIGELSDWFNKFVQKVHDIIGQISLTTSQVASASQQLSSTSEQMAAGAEEQTSQTSQVATSVEEMSATVQQVAKNASSAAESAKKSGQTATEGGEIVQNTINGIGRISRAVEKLQGVINTLNNNSEKIGNIIGVIDDVADQTNLLALNAAIEAARAGEQGRGFAVVADEVRKLAERTSSSTKEIADMVKGIQEGTTEAVSSMDSGATEVKQGVELAGKAGTALKEIINGVQSVQDMVQQIATASEEQSAAAEEISSNVESISSVAKQSSTGAKQTADSAQDLAHLSSDLQQLVNKFRLDNTKLNELGSTGTQPSAKKMNVIKPVLKKAA